jgi:hypothetical protein
MSNRIHGFNPFRIVATVPRSIVLPYGGTVVSYEVDKTNLSFETINMFRNAGYRERANGRTYSHSVLVLFDEDRDPRPLYALNALNCVAPSVAARLIALHESSGKLTLWLERFALGDFDSAQCAASCAAIRDSWQIELREMEPIDAPEVSARCVELDEVSEECVPLDALDRAVIEINKIYPLGWTSRAACKGVRS